MTNVVPIVSILALLIFGYMRNKQASRNYKRRERLWEIQERLMETLQSEKPASESTNTNNTNSNNPS